MHFGPEGTCTLLPVPFFAFLVLACTVPPSAGARFTLCAASGT